MEKKAVMERREKTHTEIPEASVTGRCMMKGKRGSHQRRLIVSITDFFIKILKSRLELCLNPRQSV